MEKSTPRKSMLFPTAIIVSLFFLWGVANNLNDVLIAQFKKAFVLSDLQSGLVQSAFYMGYFLLALPAGALMRRHGYKSAVVVGLTLFGLGAALFYPAAQLASYPVFLAALFVIASGLAFLETSANPLITVLAPPGKAEQRLNLAQAFNPLGSITGVLVGSHFILSGVEHTPESLAALTAEQSAAFYRTEIQAVQGPYLLLATIVLGWAVLTSITRFPALGPEAREGDAEPGFWRSLSQLASKPRLKFGVAAQFCCVGAQVGVWSYMIRYGQANVGLAEKTAAHWLTISLVLFMIGRFLGTALMTWVSPNRLLALFAACNVALAGFAALNPGKAGFMALVATSFFMSIMFPTIFALSVRGLGHLTKAASSLLIMSIIGGAVLTAAMGALSDLSSIAIAILAPAAAFLVVAVFAVTSPKVDRAAVKDAAGGH